MEHGVSVFHDLITMIYLPNMVISHNYVKYR